MRIGNGYDVHPFCPGRPLVLGGVTLDHPLGLLGHSDADVLLHAVMDALLGAAGLPDIGGLFPDTDPAFKGISSLNLLKQVQNRLSQAGWYLGNLDSIIIAEKPRMKAYIPEMIKNIAHTLQVDPTQVNVKATTTEKLGFIGREEGIACSAVALLTKEVQ